MIRIETAMIAVDFMRVSKLAVRGASAVFARDYAPDRIRVNTVSPGLVATDSMRASYGPDFFDRVVAEANLSWQS